MFRSDLLKDKVLVVTGGGTGLGKAMATRFGELGACVAIAARRKDVIDATAAEIAAKTGAKTLAVPCDVRDYAQVEKARDRVLEAFGRVDGLVNNAAGNFLAPSEDLTPGGFRAVVEIVLFGSFHCTHVFGKQMIAQGGGGNVLSIVTTYAWTGSAFVLPSVCGKSAVLAMTRSLAVEWAHHRIRLNAIAPGPFPTEGAWSRLMPGGGDPSGVPGDMLKKKVPLGRYGEHAELANLSAYLMADESGYITGDCVTIDGGEWLMGAGQFNFLTGYDRAAVKQMMAAMKPKKG
ncbi:MAG: SDR family oxidoreductase [Myxococcota bacterium]